MKPTRAARDARRTHRETKARRRRDDPPSVTRMAGAMDASLFASVLSAMGGLDVGARWEEVAPRIVPVLKRLRHPFPAEAAPIYLQVPPGIWTGFGIDLGPAFSHVSAPMLDAWGVGRATLLGTALENLRRKVVEEPPRVERCMFDGVELIGVQGQGWGSSLLLVPDVLRPILGTTPRLLMAPVRNTLVAMPDDIDLEVALAAWHAIADGASDELDVDPMSWTGTTVVAEGDRSLGLPN